VEKKMGTITIDDVEYQFDDLTDEQKAIVNQLSRCQQKMAELQSEYDIVQSANTVYVNNLKALLDALGEDNG
jgi:FtsZ-binding cell division protein ZapB